MTHIDDFIDNTRNTKDWYARFMFEYFRLPAHQQEDFKRMYQNFRLFCTWEGKRYRVTGASTMGDIWLNSDFTQDHGYEYRVDIDFCSLFSDLEDVTIAKECTHNDLIEEVKKVYPNWNAGMSQEKKNYWTLRIADEVIGIYSDITKHIYLKI